MPENISSIDKIFWQKWISNQNKLYVMCLKLTKGNICQAEDILSEAALHALDKYRSQHLSVQYMDGWLRSLTVNIFLQHKRKSNRHMEILSCYEYSQTEVENLHILDPQDYFSIRDYQSSYNRVKHHLSCKLQHVIDLHLLGRSYREIAIHLDIAEANVRKRIQLAKKVLQELTKTDNL